MKICNLYKTQFSISGRLLQPPYRVGRGAIARAGNRYMLCQYLYTRYCVHEDSTLSAVNFRDNTQTGSLRPPVAVAVADLGSAQK